MTEPAEVFSLAEILADEMAARGWDAIDVGVRMGGGDAMKDTLIVDLILAVSAEKYNCVIDEYTFAGLSRAFGISAEFFKNIDATWRKYPDRRSPFTPPEHLFSNLGEFPETSVSTPDQEPSDAKQ